MRQYLETQIADRDEKIARLERELLAAKAERRALADTLSHLDSDDETRARAKEALPPERKMGPRSPTPSSFQMSEHWAEILRRLDAAGRSFSAADISAMAKAVGKPMTTPNVRSQLAYYKRRKVIKRTAKGRYAVAETAREMLKTSAPQVVDGEPLKQPDMSAPHMRVVQ